MHHVWKITELLGSYDLKCDPQNGYIWRHLRMDVQNNQKFQNQVGTLCTGLLIVLVQETTNIV